MEISNEKKAREIALSNDIYDTTEVYQSDVVDMLMQMAQWKDEQLIEQLTAFAQHLNKRGAFRDDLCMDCEHEAQSFIESQIEKRKKTKKKQIKVLQI